MEGVVGKDDNVEKIGETRSRRSKDKGKERTSRKRIETNDTNISYH
jgi:hypothetical protein